jgi:hypothetical protein
LSEPRLWNSGALGRAVNAVEAWFIGSWIGFAIAEAWVWLRERSGRP